MFFFVSCQWTLCALLLMSWGWSWHVAAQTVPSLSSPPQVGNLHSFGVYLPWWYLSEKDLNFTSFHWTVLKIPFSSPPPQVYVGRFYSIGEGDTSKVPLQKYSKCFCFCGFGGYSTDGMIIKIYNKHKQLIFFFKFWLCWELETCLRSIEVLTDWNGY